MSENVLDFLRLWNLDDRESEHKISKFLLVELNKVIRQENDVLSKMKQGPSIVTPIVEWAEVRGCPSTASQDQEPLKRLSREAGIKTHAEILEIPYTHRWSYHEMASHELERRVQVLLMKIRRQLALAVLRAQPYRNGLAYLYANQPEKPAMCGICTWPVITQSEQPNVGTYVNKAGQPLTKQDLDDLARNLWLDEHANYNKGDWWIVCHHDVLQQHQDDDIVFRKTKSVNRGIVFQDFFNAGIDKVFPVLADRCMPCDALLLVNLEAMQYGYVSPNTVTRKEVPTYDKYERWLVSFETYGVVVQDPRANIGMIYGILSPKE